MAEVSGMDYEAVLKAAQNFDEAGSKLKKVDIALEAALRVLQTTFFTNLVGGAVVASYIRSLQGPIQELANKCTEMSGDLQKTVQDTRERDSEVSNLF